jgi:hypothetical protein
MLIEVGRREPAFDGMTFGEVGAYQKIVGRAVVKVDPSHPLNAGIVNIAKAPTDAAGVVTCECPFYLLMPADLRRANGALLYDVLNRGNKVALHSFNDAPRDRENPAAMAVNDPSLPVDAGNGFLMRQGFTVLWSGWQGGGVLDGADLMAARLPIAKEHGEPLVGTSRDEFVFEHPHSPITAMLSYPAARTDPAECALTVRQREGDSRTPIGPQHWRFQSNTHIKIDRPAGFDASAIYEFIYPAKDPIVMGLGFAAIRDLVAFFRYAPVDDAGTANPLAPRGSVGIDRVLAFGMSQAGRVLRDFVYQGFNEDLSGRRVFDGLMPSMTGSRKAFVNYAFAQPGRFSRQHEDRLFPHDQFPFTYATTTDPVSGKTDGIFARCDASMQCPKVIHTESSSDFFHGRASLLVTDGKGRAVPIPDSVRFYHFAGTPHGGGTATVHIARILPTKYPLNPADFSAVHRALLLALDRWVAAGIAPPPSRFPAAEDGTLVSAAPEHYGFPTIPGVRYAGRINELSELDYREQPPRPISGHDYAVSVPAIDADGNETPGIRVPEVAVPRGTHTGWAPRRKGFAEDELLALGAYFPFAATRAERAASGDPRLSLEERYPTQEHYVRQVAAAAGQLHADGFLLQEDVERIIAKAREWE